MSGERGDARELVFGLHSVRILLERHPKRVVCVRVDPGRSDARLRAVRELAASAGVAVEEVTGAELGRLAGGARHQSVCAEVTAAQALNENALERLLTQTDTPLLLVLDGVEDPRNLGACLRAAEASGADAVVAPKNRAAGLTPAARKVASGAAELVPFIRVTNLARSLRLMGSCGLRVVGADAGAERPVYASDLIGPLALVMGGEARGLRRLTREACDELVALPMRGGVESLNVAVAAGVCLYEALRQRACPRPGGSV